MYSVVLSSLDYQVLNRPITFYEINVAEFPNLRPIGQEVHELWSDIQADRQINRDNYIMYSGRCLYLYNEDDFIV